MQLPDWERVLRVNLTAPFLVTRELLPRMIARGRGRIVDYSAGKVTSTSPLIAPASMGCSGSPAAWQSKSSRIISTFTRSVPAELIRTSSKAPI